MNSPANINSYTKRDFETNIQELDRIIRERYPQDWTDFQPGRLGNVIKDLIAHDFDILSFMLDQYARERFSSTMVLRESALHLANSVGYQVKAAVGSSINLNTFLTETFPEDVVIPRGSKVSSVSGLVFESSAESVIPAGKLSPESYVLVPSISRTSTLLLGSTSVSFQSRLPDQVSSGHFLRMDTTSQDYQITYISTDRMSATISIPSLDADMVELTYSIMNKQSVFSQGETVVETMLSSGLANQIINTEMSSVLEGSVRVFVNNSEWSAVDSVVQELNINVFSVRYDADDSPLISFGDGITGNIPPENSSIRIQGRVGVGVEGNIARGSINTVLSVPVGAESVSVRFSNPASEGSGGSDRQTIQEITEGIPAYIRSNDTAVTEEDYVSLSTGYTDPQYGRIEKAVVVLSTNFVPYEMNLIKIYAWSSNGIGVLVPPSDGLRSSLKSFLDSRKMIGTEVYILDGLNKEIDLILDITFDISKDKQKVKDQVTSAVETMFTATFISPGKPLYLSKVYEAVESVVGVETVYVSADPPFISGAIPSSNIEMMRLGSLTLREAPEAPAFVVVPITSLDGSSVIQWGIVDEAVDYEVEISDHPSYSSTTNLGYYTDNIASVSGLSTGIYYFRVRSRNASGVSQWKESTNSTQVILP